MVLLAIAVLAIAAFAVAADRITTCAERTPPSCPARSPEPGYELPKECRGVDADAAEACVRER